MLTLIWFCFHVPVKCKSADYLWFTNGRYVMLNINQCTSHLQKYKDNNVYSPVTAICYEVNDFAVRGNGVCSLAASYYHIYWTFAIFTCFAHNIVTECGSQAIIGVSMQPGCITTTQGATPRLLIAWEYDPISPTAGLAGIRNWDHRDQSLML